MTTSKDSVGASPKMLFVTALTEYADSDLEGVGTTRVDQYGRKFRWVYNSGDEDARAGSPACFDATNIGYAYFMQRVPVEDVAAGDLPFFAGVWMSAVPTANYGWVLTFGVYDTARVAAASASSYAAGDYLVANVSTDTAATGAAACYSFTQLGVSTLAVGTGAGTAVTIDQLMRPSVTLLDVCASRGTAAALTTAQTLSVFVKGLIQ